MNRSLTIIHARTETESFSGNGVEVTGGDELNLWFKSSPCESPPEASITMRIESSTDGVTFSGIPGAELEVGADADSICQLDLRIEPSTRYIRGCCDVRGGEFTFAISAISH